MQFDPAKRFTAADALLHPYFSSEPAPTPLPALPHPKVRNGQVMSHVPCMISSLMMQPPAPPVSFPAGGSQFGPGYSAGVNGFKYSGMAPNGFMHTDGMNSQALPSCSLQPGLNGWVHGNSSSLERSRSSDHEQQYQQAWQQGSVSQLLTNPHSRWTAGSASTQEQLQHAGGGVTAVGSGLTASGLGLPTAQPQHTQQGVLTANDVPSMRPPASRPPLGGASTSRKRLSDLSTALTNAAGCSQQQQQQQHLWHAGASSVTHPPHPHHQHASSSGFEPPEKRLHQDRVLASVQVNYGEPAADAAHQPGSACGYASTCAAPAPSTDTSGDQACPMSLGTSTLKRSRAMFESAETEHTHVSDMCMSIGMSVRSTAMHGARPSLEADFNCSAMSLQGGLVDSRASCTDGTPAMSLPMSLDLSACAELEGLYRPRLNSADVRYLRRRKLVMDEALFEVGCRSPIHRSG